jgi:hypothetical protein
VRKELILERGLKLDNRGGDEDVFEIRPEGRNPRKGIIIQKPMEVSYDSES